jgi:hypothetical protein
VLGPGKLMRFYKLISYEKGETSGHWRFAFYFFKLRKNAQLLKCLLFHDSNSRGNKFLNNSLK